MNTEEKIKNNPWVDAHKYADNKYHMEKGDHISKYERYEEIKEAFEAGYKQCQEDMVDKKYVEGEMLFAFVHGGTTFEENKNADTLAKNFKALINALKK